MLKKCSRCGSEMTIMLRNVVYRKRVKIYNVPVHVCGDYECSHSQVVEMIKEDLKQLMKELGPTPRQQEIEFEQISELSHLLVYVADQTETSQETAVRTVVENRVNELLDLFLLAQSLGDERWCTEIRNRLVQIV
ncbi:hypothetical protein ACTID9_20180 [Brevibacillus fluminis]|uniref:hypothetical protein n=1 Tax=Brevibacillus fluminis TaxID=511487 RepID=UPI003F88BD50